jgi:hypothetical protein
MPIKPHPKLMQCPNCGWQTIYAPRSDALIEHRPETCPKCGNKELDIKQAGIANLAISLIASLLKRN